MILEAALAERGESEIEGDEDDGNDVIIESDFECRCRSDT